LIEEGLTIVGLVHVTLARRYAYVCHYVHQ